ncbi:hypothetical protein BpHYR1_015617 [Brachionus plicatilis]|uniref:Uncharacterized protein n=1 Tax=Brachionus plicatilis TaxID=10195 RepID=A0A3M7PSU6_BRAPC|nr:hypothetical protein BpHYR1_015617 [Brachionus plicatilis]
MLNFLKLKFDWRELNSFFSAFSSMVYLGLLTFFFCITFSVVFGDGVGKFCEGEISIYEIARVPDE